MLKKELEAEIKGLKITNDSLTDSYLSISRELERLEKYKTAFEHNDKIIRELIAGSDCAFEMFFGIYPEIEDKRLNTDTYCYEQPKIMRKVAKDDDGARYNEWVINKLQMIDHHPETDKLTLSQQLANRYHA